MNSQMIFDPINRVHRLSPVMPVGAMQTYRVAMPVKSHWVPATCAQIGCQPYLNGWETPVLPGSADEARLRAAGRKWAGVRCDERGFNVYRFPAGTRCLRVALHRIQTDRPALFILQDGDWRWSGAPKVFDRPDQWVDHFATHQDRIATIVNRG